MPRHPVELARALRERAPLREHPPETEMRFGEIGILAQSPAVVALRVELGAGSARRLEDRAERQSCRGVARKVREAEIEELLRGAGARSFLIVVADGQKPGAPERLL